MGLQQSKAAAASLVSIQSMEVQLRADSGGKAAIARFHHDDDKSFRGPVEEYARQRGWEDTHTGGYNPNSNAQPEVRIGMLKQLFRVVLLCATGGHMYYGQLWDVGMVYCNMIVNHRKWTDRESPISQLTGSPAVLPEKVHVFGAYVLCSGTWTPDDQIPHTTLDTTNPHTHGTHNAHLLCML